MSLVHRSMGRFTACGKKLAGFTIAELAGAEDGSRVSCTNCLDRLSLHDQRATEHDTLNTDTDKAGTDGTTWEETARAREAEAERRRVRDRLVDEDWGYGSFLPGQRRVSRMLGSSSRPTVSPQSETRDPSDLFDNTRI